MKIKNRDDFAKIHFGYRSVLATVFAIICLVLLGISYKTIAGNKAQMNRSFENCYSTVENKLGIFLKVSDAMFANSDVQGFSKAINGEYNAYKVVPARKVIEQFEKFFTDGECSIVLTNFEDGICASVKGGVRFDEVCNELMLDDTTINSIKNNHIDEKFYDYNKEKGIINFIFRHRYDDGGGNLYCVITANDKSLLSNENLVIADGSSMYKDRSENSGFIKIEKIYVKESETVSGLVYKYSAKYDHIVLLVFLIIGIMLCLVGMFCSKKLTEKILNATYRPLIRAARQGAEDKALQNLDAWDKSAQKLICDNEIMRNNLKENKTFCKKTYLRNLLYDIEDYQGKYLEEYDLRYLEAECRVILMDFAHKNEYVAVRGRLTDTEFEGNLENQLSKNISGEFIPVNEGRYAYITSFCDKDELRKKLADVLEFAASCRLDAFISVGDKTDGIKNVKTSFRNALDGMERKNVFPTHFIVFSSELTNELSSFYYPIDVEVQIIDNILAGNQEALDEILGKVLARNLYEISLTAEKMRELKIVMVGTINRAINRMNKEASDIFGENSSVYLEIGASRNKEEFAKSVRSVFGSLCTYNENGNESKSDKSARDIMTYIETNFDDSDLSLEKVAKIFFISQNHVSRVLKTKIGKSYKEYLNDVRINEAKRLLKNTPMTVLGVANSVGYTDIRAFNRLFKKYTNCTPNEYRAADNEEKA